MFLIRDWCYPYEHDYGLEGGNNFLDKRLQVRIFFFSFFLNQVENTGLFFEDTENVILHIVEDIYAAHTLATPVRHTTPRFEKHRHAYVIVCSTVCKFAQRDVCVHIPPISH